MMETNTDQLISAIDHKEKVTLLCEGLKLAIAEIERLRVIDIFDASYKAALRDIEINLSAMVYRLESRLPLHPTTRL